MYLIGFNHPHSPWPSITAKNRLPDPDKATKRSRSNMREPSQNTFIEYEESEMMIDPFTGCVNLYSPFSHSIVVNSFPRFETIASLIDLSFKNIA